MTTLAELCSAVDYGYTASASDDSDVGPKFLRITDIVPDSIAWSNVPHCVIEDDKCQRYLLDEGDIVVARTGATVGYAKQIWARPEGATFASYLVRFRPDPERVDPYYLGQIVQSAAYKRWVKSVAGGAAQPNASARLLGSFDVPLLPPESQRRVGRALRAIGELIENNRRRIEILEEMALLLYREWFVHFRFPGHEKADLVESCDTSLPEGWGAATLGEVSENFDRLRKPLSKMERSKMQGEYPYYGAAKIVDYVNDWILEGEYLLFAEDGTVMTSDGFPVLQLVNGRFWVNNHTHILHGKGLPTRLLWLAVANYPISGHVTGAAQPKITQANLNRVPVIKPAEAVVGEFMLAIDPLVDLLQNMARQSDLLSESRDLLLPRLITGELDASDIDLDLEPVA